MREMGRMITPATAEEQLLTPDHSPSSVISCYVLLRRTAGLERVFRRTSILAKQLLCFLQIDLRLVSMLA
jgi:hypothetical protein